MKSLAGLMLVVLSLVITDAIPAGSFRVRPYLQNPTSDGMTIRWLSEGEGPGIVTIDTPEGPRELRSQPTRATALAYNPLQPEPGGPHPDLPWLHTVRVTGLKPGANYSYDVRQGNQKHSGKFQTAPGPDQAVRFLVYSDPETEPESSTSPPVDWPPPPNSNRPPGQTKYVADQTVGYRENCRLMQSRQPNFVSIVGDLVETGGEQRDWDEFWKHNAGEYGSLASEISIVPALGNHENYAGQGGGYTAQGANFATEKFRTYFEVPGNQAGNPKYRGRYYRFDYGPITLITLDSSDGLPHQSIADTNHTLQGSDAPDFNPNSEQYRWFVRQLEDTQKTSRFTFVQFHHTMYGSGPHSIPFGHPNFSGQSGIAMRVIQPLLLRYGVDAVFSGHDEMLERSAVTGQEVLPDGSTRMHTVQFYDVGIGGDGLRGPSTGFDNPHRKFLAHEDATEVWKGRQLVSGGKHYGHLEVDVAQNAGGEWQAVLTPVYVFPLLDPAGKVTGWERRTYDDVITLKSGLDSGAAAIQSDASTDCTGIIAVLLMTGLGTAPWLCRNRRNRKLRQAVSW